ncbi:WD40 repeat-like protein [Karstenula rhodostoma CBS 690.94]|uniref:WD40 repeat-like protein n=1 Tax=Karstenula rhodostoma CBS 690.94 TaxID=1392251 RepID=A0A9P4PZZ3_9PLEO|nr:WD40 repeat-like protein [Karstenula rhodostoma CBS 690.94]
MCTRLTKGLRRPCYKKQYRKTRNEKVQICAECEKLKGGIFSKGLCSTCSRKRSGRGQICGICKKSKSGIYKGQTDKVSSLDISPDGTPLVAGADDNTVMVWDMQTRDVRHVLRDHSRWVCSAIFSPNGRQIASCSMDETIILWDTQTAQDLQTFDNHSSCVNSIAFSPNGYMIVSGSVDEIIRMWSIS